MRKILLLVLCMILLIPSVLADLVVPSTSEYILYALIPALIPFIINYVINVILVLILSSIWFKLSFKRILLGLLIITPIMLILEIFLFNIFNRELVIFGLLGFVVVFLNYFIISKLFWKLDNRDSIFTAIIMGILTNPVIFAYFVL